MGKKKKQNKTISMVVNGAAIIFGAMVIVSMFMAYISVTLPLLGKQSTTGFKILGEDGNGFQKTMIMLTLIFAAATAAFALLRLIGMDNKLFTLLFLLCALALVVCSVILFSIILTVFGKNGSVKLSGADRGIGVWLNLIFSCLVAACAGAAFLTAKK